ncbi:MAG: NACHT domain-containing protein [Scytonema hyalinum WJT4-NPBG1]|jgi:DNA polymerase III delta prime subunit|nr:NACHT domain-containing protein [Scytonema hyalinum WJT4-NPBG1]
MPESQDPKEPEKVTNNDLRNSQFGGGFINADTVNAQRIGGDIWNIKNFFFGQHEAASGKQLTRQEYENRRILLSKVRNSWVQGVLERSLYGRVLIELGLEERLDAVNHLGEMVWETPDQPRQILPVGTRVIDKFDEMVAGRTLLILGEPGSGKTTTLLELARDLIDCAHNNINQPIPVVFNLSSWGSEKQNQTIADWLVQRLNQEYKVSKKLGTFWVKNQQLLLLLDGLDEVKEERQNLCVQALNRFRQDYGETEIVIASRVFDYERLSYRLDLQSAIYLQPLTQEQINHYFDNAGSQLAVVKTLWQEDETLQELAKSPLILNIMSFAYQGVESENFPKINSLDERRKHLFDKYIQRMFERRRSLKKQRYSKKESIHWLTWLAKRMFLERESVFLIERIQPSLLGDGTQQWIYRIGFVLATGIILSLIAYLIVNLFNELIYLPISEVFKSSDYRINSWLISRLIKRFNLGYFWYGVIFASINLILNKVRNLEDIKRFETIILSRTKLLKSFSNGRKRGTRVGMLFGMLFGIIVLLIGLFNSPINSGYLKIIKNYDVNIATEMPLVPRLFLSIIFGITMWIIVGLLFWENNTLKKTCGMCGLLMGLIFFVGLGLGNSSLTLEIVSVVFFVFVFTLLFSGLIYGLIGGLIGGLISVFISGLRGDDLDRRTVPNQGIFNTIKNAGIFALIGGLIGGLISVFIELILYRNLNIYISPPSRVSGVNRLIGLLYEGSFFYGLNFALIPGLAVIKHFTLRLILYFKKYIPWNYARFLDYATERILLQKVGGGYIFIHRLLQDHFAQMEFEIKHPK